MIGEKPGMAQLRSDAEWLGATLLGYMANASLVHSAFVCGEQRADAPADGAGNL